MSVQFVPVEEKSSEEKVEACPNCRSSLEVLEGMVRIVASTNVPNKPPGIWVVYVPLQNNRFRCVCGKLLEVK